MLGTLLGPVSYETTLGIARYVAALGRADCATTLGRAVAFKLAILIGCFCLSLLLNPIGPASSSSPIQWTSSGGSSPRITILVRTQWPW